MKRQELTELTEAKSISLEVVNWWQMPSPAEMTASLLGGEGKKALTENDGVLTAGTLHYRGRAHSAPQRNDTTTHC